MFQPFRNATILILLFACAVSAGEYTWPTDASTVITSSFGEYRPNHIHGGVDVKTWGHEGYQALAIDSGSVVKVSVSPYGYGRRVHFRTRDHWIAVYAHLSRFSPVLEKIIREEQKRQGRYEVEKDLEPGQLILKKGEPVGYTGSTGANTPHLHFEIRDPDDRLINPFVLGYRIQDSQIPVLQALSATPLCYGSHVDGDFTTKPFALRKTARGKYTLDRVFTCWGDVGLALSSFDMAEGSPNTFAVYRVSLFVDECPVFTAEYNRFPIQQIGEIDMERDYRLIRRGMGLFQKLYIEEGNTLPFYIPDMQGAGFLCSMDDGGALQTARAEPGRIRLKRGDHTLRITASDYAGNTAEATGTFRMVPLSETVGTVLFPGHGWSGGVPGKIRVPNLVIEKHFLDAFLAVRLRFDTPLSEIPRMSVWMNGFLHALVPLVPRSTKEFIGEIPLDRGVDGTMVTDVRFLCEGGQEKTVTDTARVLRVTPGSGGTLVSADGLCRVVFPAGSVYKAVWAWIEIEKDAVNASNGLGKLYSIAPADFPLKKSIQVFLNTSSMRVSQDKIAVFMKPHSNMVFIGNERKDGTVSAWLGSLVPFTAIADTVPPVLFSVRPGAGVRVAEKKPRIAIRFNDKGSGVYGEENYSVKLDSVNLIMEFDPRSSTAFSVPDDPLAPGKHILEIAVRDRLGNVTKSEKTFFVDPR